MLGWLIFCIKFIYFRMFLSFAGSLFILNFSYTFMAYKFYYDFSAYFSFFYYPSYFWAYSVKDEGNSSVWMLMMELRSGLFVIDGSPFSRLSFNLSKAFSYFLRYLPNNTTPKVPLPSYRTISYLLK